MRKILPIIAAISAMCGGVDVPSAFREKNPKDPKKCLLPGCDKTTTHNGGYCCAEHCKEHKRILRNNK